MAPNKRGYWDGDGTLCLLNEASWPLARKPECPPSSAHTTPKGSPQLSLYGAVWSLESILTFFFFPPGAANVCYHFISVEQLWKQKDMRERKLLIKEYPWHEGRS